MFWRAQLRLIFWEGNWGKTITGLWSVASLEWLAIAFLYVLVWRHGSGPGSHPPPGCCQAPSHAAKFLNAAEAGRVIDVN
jgi:hypothetical protein